MTTTLADVDAQHEALLRDPQFDPKERIEKGLKSALAILVDVLALIDGHPNRSEYAAQLIEAHTQDPDPQIEMLDTVVAWLQDARAEGDRP